METNETLTRKKRYITPTIDELPLELGGLMEISASGSNPSGGGGDPWGGEGAKQSNGLINYMNFDEMCAAYDESADNVFDYY